MTAPQTCENVLDSEDIAVSVTRDITPHSRHRSSMVVEREVQESQNDLLDQLHNAYKEKTTLKCLNNTRDAVTLTVCPQIIAWYLAATELTQELCRN